MTKLILIVDDDVNFAGMIGRRLKAAGYEILVSFDAISATRQALTRQPDLIILDLKLPAGGGYRVYQRLKDSTITALIPVMFVTGFNREAIPEMGWIENLEDRLLTKPVKSEELLAKVRIILGEAEDTTAPAPTETDREFAAFTDAAT